MTAAAMEWGPQWSWNEVTIGAQQAPLNPRGAAHILAPAMLALLCIWPNFSLDIVTLALSVMHEVRHCARDAATPFSSPKS